MKYWDKFKLYTGFSMELKEKKKLYLRDKSQIID